MEDKISALEAEALQLKLSLNMGKEAMEREEKEKRELTAEMQTLLDSNATEDHFRSVRENYSGRLCIVLWKSRTSLTDYMDIMNPKTLT